MRDSDHRNHCNQIILHTFCLELDPSTAQPVSGSCTMHLPSMMCVNDRSWRGRGFFLALLFRSCHSPISSQSLFWATPPCVSFSFLLPVSSTHDILYPLTLFNTTLHCGRASNSRNHVKCLNWFPGLAILPVRCLQTKPLVKPSFQTFRPAPFFNFVFLKTIQ